MMSRFRRLVSPGAIWNGLALIGESLPLRRPALSDTELLKRLYDRFNARDMEALLATMHPDVVWANGMEGGHVYGHEGVRNYWTRQWAAIDPHVEPVGFIAGGEGAIEVEVQQIVRDLKGKKLSDTFVGHIFRIERGLIRRFDIRN
jgi:ketosteroid isomerase-like protein